MEGLQLERWQMLFLLILLILHTIVFFLGLIGNISVIRVVRSTRSMHTATNYLLANLALADILTLLTNPYLVGQMFVQVVRFQDRSWSPVTKDWICRLIVSGGVVGVFIGVSIGFLLVVAVERYHAMVKPMSARLRLEKEQVWKVAVGVWIIAILTNIPIFRDIYFDAKSKHCFVAWHFTTGEGMATYVGCYMAILNCVSGILIAFCYVSILKGLYITNTICSEMVPTNDGRDSKKKLAKLVATVTASFYILLIPYAIFTIYMAAAEKPRGNTAYSNDALFVSFYVTSSLCMVNSCINPILYALQSSSYRRGFAKLYPCCMKHQEEEMAAPARHANPSCNSTTQAHA